MEMSEQNTGSKFENAIKVENLSKYLSNDEREKIEDMLHSNNIDIVFYETGPKADLFSAITIFFNEPLTKMIITGLITSSTYDAIKFVVLCFLSKLKNIFLVSFSSKQNELIKKPVQLDLRFKAGNAEMNALIPNNFTHEQNLEYLDRVLKAMIELGKTQIPHMQTREFYVIDSDDDKAELLKVKTMVQYCKEQRKKQQKAGAQ
jgi:hypothetical protein